MIETTVQNKYLVSPKEIKFDKVHLYSEVGERALKFISKCIDLDSADNYVILSTGTKFNIEIIESIHGYDKPLDHIINVKRVNEYNDINEFLREVNHQLPVNGKYVGCVETYSTRKKNVYRKYIFPFNRAYYLVDYLLRRVMPKIKLTKGLHDRLFKKRGKVISLAECFGRIYSQGFKIEEFIKANDKIYFSAVKTSLPKKINNASYGPIFRMARVGQNGKPIHVFKIRTMHAYSEFLQEYIYERGNLSEGGKFRNDFRITTVGKWMRKLWVDELPMLVNVLKGEMKIVGVRPISKHYLSLYTEELRKFRLNFKPGLIPPFYADMPKTLEDIMASEMNYLKAYKNNPIKTDLTYFVKAIFNIVFKKARSK